MTPNTKVIAIIKGQEADVAEVRYNAARKLEVMVTAARISGQPYTWIVERA